MFLTRTTGTSGSSWPKVANIASCNSQNSFIFLSSSGMLRLTAMLTMLPEVTPLGSKSEGNSIR